MKWILFRLLLLLSFPALSQQMVAAGPIGPAADTPASSRVVSVADFGAKGDGVTDDTAAINAAVLATSSAGGGTVTFPSTPAGYLLKRAVPDQQYGGIMLRPGVSLCGDQTKLILAGNCSFMYAGHPIGPAATVVANTKAGDTTLSVDDGSRFTKGQTVLVRLGQSTYDAGEPEWWIFAKVSESTKRSVTLDRPIPYAMALDHTPAAQRSVWAVTRVEGITIEGFRLINPMTGGGNAEAGMNLSYCHDLHIRDIEAENPGAGAILAQYCDDLDLQEIHVACAAQQEGEASKGRAIGFAECRDVTVRNFAAENFASAAAFIESQCTGIRFQGIHLLNNAVGRDPRTPLFGVIYKNQVTINDLTVTGQGTNIVDEGGAGGSSSVEIPTSTWSTSTPCTAYSLTRFGNGSLGRLTVGSVPYQEVRHWKREFPLTPSRSELDIGLPQGTYRRVTLTVSGTIGLSGFYILDSAGDAFEFVHAGLQAGKPSEAWNHSGGAWPGAPAGINQDRGKKTAIYTTAAVPPGSWGTLDVDYYPN